MSNNPYFEELEKLANTSAAIDDGEDMNPDQQAKATDGEVQKEQADGSAEKDEKKKSEEDEEKEAAEYDELREVIASALPQFGAFAMILEYANGGDDIDEDLQKQAQERLELLLTDEESYTQVIEKTASEFFSSQENLDSLTTVEGIHFITEHLASFLENEELEKQAEEGESFIGKVRTVASNFINSIKEMNNNSKNLDVIQGELETASNELAQVRSQVHQDMMTNPGVPSNSMPQMTDLLETVDDLDSRRVNGQIGKGLKWSGAAGGVALAGAGIHGAVKHFNQPSPEEQIDPMQQVASEYDNQLEKLAKVLSDGSTDDTLKLELKNETNGGIHKMSKAVVKDFLKIAGAAGLITIVNDEGLNGELRKEASDRFDEISTLGKTAMGEEFVKVAQEIYTEDQLHEIVAGHHSEELLTKVAFFTESVPEMSTSQLEKIANAGGVAAKGVAGALTDSKAVVENRIKEEKEAAEGKGREYVGDLASTGKAGGGLVGGTAGYNVINNPGKYDVEKTAQSLEEAVMLKQAAVQAYNEADAYIKQFAK